MKPRWNRFKLFQFHLNHFPDQFSQLQLLHAPLKDMLDSSYNYPETSLFLSKTEKQVAFSQLKLLNVAKEYVVIVPGAAWRQKTWSIEGYSKIIDSLGEKNISTVMLGTSTDLICKQLAQLNRKIINLQGKTNVRESLAIISQANLVIGGDTGFVHGAEALKIPVVMIMGPTTIETGGGVNLSISKNIEVHDLWCRPCSQNGSKRCYRNEQYCMSTISSSQVFSAVQKVFSK
jgi:ADP-heptose:LPS heptosyltransferase